MGSPRKVFGVVFVTLHTSPVSVHLHLISAHLDFLSREAALRHQRVLRHKKTSTVERWLFVLKGAFEFNHAERKSGAALCHVDCNFPACGFFFLFFFLSKPISVFPASGLPLNGCGKSPGSNHNEDASPSGETIIHPSTFVAHFLLHERSRGFVGVDHSCHRAKAGLRPGQVAASSRSRRDNMMY